MIYYITGGERSGKSSFAQKLAFELTENPSYIATAKIWDEDFAKRVERHKKDRDERWINYEEEKNIAEVKVTSSAAVIDCVTLWLTNLFDEYKNDVDECLDFAKQQVDILEDSETIYIMVSNELGMGVHASEHSTRKFVELQGWVNQYLASKAVKAYLLVSGIPLKLK
jgi:Adenosyl cobinamide kinase/adenosyl cobinamide phosphate guanylyltransferase